MFWLDIIALSVSAVLASSLGLIVLGSGTKNTLNLSFALFIFIEAAWAICSLLLRLDLWLERGNPLLLGEIASLTYSLAGPALLMFTTRYVNSRTRWTDLCASIGIAVIAILTIPLFNHLLVHNAYLELNGATTLEISTAGKVLAVVPLVFITWSLVLFWVERRHLGEPYLALSVLTYLLGFIVGGVLNLRAPIVSITNTVSIALLGYGILSRRLFNPLRQVNIELERKVEERTRELEKAFSKVEERVEERTSELKREVAERKRAEEALIERAARLELIAQVGQRTTAILGLNELIYQAVELIQETFEYHRVTILLVEGDRLVLRAAAPPSLREYIGRIRLRIGEEGITGWVAAEGEPLLVPDVNAEPRYYSVIEKDHPNSELAVPLKIKGRIIGVLDSQSMELNGFSERDVFTLQTIADQLAIAIENVGLYEETRKRAERLTVLNRIARAVGTTLNLDDLMEIVYEEVSAIFQTDAFLIALYDKASNELDFRVLMDRGVREPLTRKPLGDGLTSLVILEKRPLFFKDLEKEKDRLPSTELWGTMELPRSWLGAPMKIGEKITGVICVQAYQPDVYSEEELLLLSTISDQIAVAVENARLYETAQEELAERKRAEEVLQESEEKFRSFTEQSPNMIFINSRGRVVYANKVCEEIMGYRREEFYAEDFDFLTLIAPEYHDFIKSVFSKHLAGKEIPPYEYAIVTKTGKRHDTIITTKLIKYDGQNALLGIITDITKRKRTERLLQSLNATALAIEEALIPDEIFPTVGQAFKKLGFSSAILLIDENKKSLELKYADKPTNPDARRCSVPLKSVDAFYRVVSERKTLLLEEDAAIRKVSPGILQKLDEPLKHLLSVPKSIFAPLIAENEVVGLLVVQSDDLTEDDLPAITAFAHQLAATWHKAGLMKDLQLSLEELKQAQEQLFQSQKMEAVGKLAGGIAHDFNNLLTAIMGYTELLLMDIEDEDPRGADLEEIKKATERAGTLTRQLLAFSRKQMLQPRVLSLNEVVTGVEQMLRRLIGEDIELTVSLNSDIGLVKADPGQIEQVIMNLAVNARDAMPSGGKLTIETSNNELGREYTRRHPEARPGPYIMLAVSDTGIGMNKEIQSHIFEPFFTTKDHGKGTGLGLSTVYGIIKQSNGHIGVYSEPGKGSTFKIYLPRSDDSPEHRKPGEKPAGNLKGSETILLTEDEDMLRELARRVLIRNGYTVLEASRGAEAIKISEQHPDTIHLLITDVVMPGGMGGRELGEKLVTLRPDMEVLYISGYTDSAIVKNGMLDPDISFLQKPFTPDVLARKVREILDSSSR